MVRAALSLVAMLLVVSTASAAVTRIEIRRRDEFRTYVRYIGRVFFTVDPSTEANSAIADLRLAPRNAAGLVEFSSDVLWFQPKTPAARRTVFLEIVNRGRDQSLGLLSGAVQQDLAPEHWDLGDRFLLDHGFALAFLGWQFDVPAGRGLTIQVPAAPVDGTVRADFVETGAGARPSAFAIEYCAADPAEAGATLTFRSRIEGPAELVPRGRWRFGPGGCSVRIDVWNAAAGRGGGRLEAGVYEAVYRVHGSPVAGLGLAAVRDFTAYLKYGGPDSALGGRPAPELRLIGFGYSQSGRFLRDFVRDGFNADEQGRQVFDGLMIASAGAGGGSFNHRFAMPSQAGNSVLSILRPVDLPPFVDSALLARANASGTTPRIFYTLSSTEYWARAASLTHTSEDAASDVPLASTSRLYFLAGTPHASGPLPPAQLPGYQHAVNFAEQRWSLRALLLDLDAWVRSNTEPPASRYPTIAAGNLLPRAAVTFPAVRSLPFPAYMPQVWRMDYGPEWSSSRVIANEPPRLGAPYSLLVPRVNADGNDEGGVRLPEVAVPLGTFTGWNITVPPLPGLGHLAGLIGSFEPFARTSRERERWGDVRLSIDERYTGRKDYLRRIEQAAAGLVRDRLLLPEDVAAVVRRAEAMWAAIVEGDRQR